MKLLFAGLAAVFMIGCNSASPVQVNSTPSNTSANSERQQTVISHSSENKTPPNMAPDSNSGQKSKWSQGGSAIDTKEFDEAIARAEMGHKTKPSDPEITKSLSEAYYKRGVALTEARQYASALGDYRRAVKYDPSNEEAKGWIDKIIMIYDSMNKEYPKEGEEPPPLPFAKGK